MLDLFRRTNPLFIRSKHACLRTNNNQFIIKVVNKYLHPFRYLEFQKSSPLLPPINFKNLKV